MGGSAPRGFVDYVIMKEMGWTYQELMDTPDEVVNNIIRYMNTEAKYRKEASREG